MAENPVQNNNNDDKPEAKKTFYSKLPWKLKCFKKSNASSESKNLLKSDDVEKADTDSKKPDEASKPTIISKWKNYIIRLKTLVIDSSKTNYYYWLGIVTSTILYNSITIPLRSAFSQFDEISPKAWFCMDMLVDCVNLLDSFVGSRTGYLEEGLLVSDLKKLAYAYFKRKEFILDTLALLPTDLLALIPYLNSYQSWLRFNRFAKIYQLFEFVDRTETRTNRPNLFRISMLTVYILILIHFNACIYFGFSKATGLGADSFVYPPRSSEEISDEPYNYSARWDRLVTQYTYSFYWSTLILTTIGETPKPVRNAEYIFITIDFLVGVLIFATVVGNVGAMITNMNAARTEFQNRMDGVKRYMEFRKVNKNLELRVIRWFDYLWTNKQSLEEDSLNALPDKLKAEIAINVHFETLQRVSIFKDCDPGLLVELVLKLQLQVFSPGDYICRKGDIGREMYIVKRGKLSVVSEDGKKVFVTLGEGSVFGEISILNIAGNKTGNRRSANVRSVGYSDLFCLSKDDLWDALTEYPDTKTLLIQRGQEILRKDNLLDEELLKKSQLEQESINQCVERLDDTVSQMTKRLARLIGEFGSSHSKMKRRITQLEQLFEQFSSLPANNNNNNNIDIIENNDDGENENENNNNSNDKSSINGAIETETGTSSSSIENRLNGKANLHYTQNAKTRIDRLNRSSVLSNNSTSDKCESVSSSLMVSSITNETADSS